MEASETKQIATMLERIGWNALLHCEGLPESVLHWPPPMPYASSLFSLTVQLLEGMEWWLLRPLGLHPTLDGQELSISSLQTFTDIKNYYIQCIREVYSVLDTLSDLDTQLYVKAPLSPTDRERASRIPVRMCLLFALERCAVLLGQIQLLRQFFDDGERILQEINETQPELDETIPLSEITANSSSLFLQS
ncbi:MAG TPA: hypothetical protein DHW02_05805 [Ktedonobacter sp.]|nr:hypothetical protein [Ktedonobacter sp.]